MLNTITFCPPALNLTSIPWFLALVTVLLIITEFWDPKHKIPVVNWFNTLLFVIVEFGQPFFWNPTNNPNDAPFIVHPVM